MKYKESNWDAQKTKTYSLETEISANLRRFKIRRKISLIKIGSQMLCTGNCMREHFSTTCEIFGIFSFDLIDLFI